MSDVAGQVDAPDAPDAAAAQLEAIAQRLLAALVPLRVASVSFHDEDADVLWLTESVLGPDEHEAVRASLEIFAGEGAPVRHEYDLGDGRIALTLRVSHAGGSVLGVIMIIVEQRILADRKLSPLADGPKAATREFANWLADDMSATQVRLRALPDLSAAGLPDDDDFDMEFVEFVPPSQAPAAPVAHAPLVLAPMSPAPVVVAPASVATVAAPVAAGMAPIDPALDRHFSALRAQPIVLYAQQLEPVLQGSRIRRYEILLRTGTGHGLSQAPVAMLEAATKKGLGSVVDRRVVTDLIVWLARSVDLWRTNPIAVTVNLSATSLVDPHFLKFLELCLAKSGLPRGILGFELDATVCARQAQRTREFAEVLAVLGCKLVLDDFSLAEGQLGLLETKGLRMLKLHPQLTNAAATEQGSQAIVSGIAQMARVNGMHTCAKSVESTQQLSLLAALKVDFAQGFAFSVPRPLADLRA